MKVDLYTKSVLTIIAMCLLWLCAESTIRPQTTFAQNQASSRVIIAGIDVPDSAFSPPSTHLPARIMSLSNYVTGHNPMPVKIQSK
jgi:hypothetical protein